MELLISASIGIGEVDGKLYLVIIADDNYNFYFVPLSEKEARSISLKENLEIAPHPGPQDGDKIIGGL